MKCQCCLDIIRGGEEVFLLKSANTNVCTRDWLCKLCSSHLDAVKHDFPIIVPEVPSCAAVRKTTIISGNRISIGYKFCNSNPFKDYVCCYWHKDIPNLSTDVIEEALRPGGHLAVKAQTSFETLRG